MMKFEKSFQEDEQHYEEDEQDYEEDEQHYVYDFLNCSKASTSSCSLLKPKGGKTGKQETKTTRAKHIASEQRRRNRINHRFQILRDIIPHNDQKKDKASFLLEVIEYIQYLQQKVNKYDSSFRAWNYQPATWVNHWRNGRASVENKVDHSPASKSGPGTDMMFTGKFNDNIAPNHTVLRNTPKPLDLGLNNNMSTTASQNQQQPISEEENVMSQSQCPSHFWPNRPCTHNCSVARNTFNEHDELAIEGGTISLEGVYSEGLLNNLTQALQSSGVDLSQATISVQVDIGKRAISRMNRMVSVAKDDENASGNQAMTHSRIASSGEDSNETRKRPRTQ